MSKEDWIILRLIHMAVWHSPKARMNVHTIKALTYLRKKYGKRVVFNSLDSLLMEELK